MSDPTSMKSVPELAAVPPAEEEEQGGGGEGDDSLLMFTEEDDEEFDPLKRTGSLSQRTNSLSAGNKPTPPMAQRTQAPPLIPSTSTPTGSGGSGLLGDLSGLDLGSGAQQPAGGGMNSVATSSTTNTIASLQEMLEPLQASSTLAGSQQQPAMLTSATPLTQQTAQIQVCDHNLL